LFLKLLEILVVLELASRQIQLLLPELAQMRLQSHFRQSHLRVVLDLVLDLVLQNRSPLVQPQILA
jgi:hypothetical protein